jgi:dienelactone hydrolase
MTRFLPWMYYTRKALSEPIIFDFFTKLRSAPEEGGKYKIAAAGFCWGGNWAFQISCKNTVFPEGEPLVDVLFAAHPGNLTDVEFNGVDVPVSVAIGTEDMGMKPPAQEHAIEIFKKREEKGELKYEFIQYEGAHHGM